jgi:LCP family protein required for cell wall assembly
MRTLEKSRIDRVKKKQRKKWTLRILALVVIALIFGVGFLGAQIWGVFANSGKHFAQSKLRDTQGNLKDKPFTVLLIGADQRGAHSKDWRSDVLILVAVNPKTKSAKIVSIPRDIYTMIPNSGGVKTKINASAYYGYKSGVGPIQNIREAVENLLQVPVDYYAKLNFQGFEDAVNALGGVDVDVKFPFHQQMIGGKMAYFEPGKHHLNGAEALAYVRMRHMDPKGDLGRNERQREVLTNLMDKIASVQGVFNFGDVLKAVGDNFEMSFKPSDIPSLVDLYRQIPKQNIESIAMKVTFDNVPGVGDVDILHKDERDRIRKILQDELNYHPKTEKIQGNGTDSTVNRTGAN